MTQRNGISTGRSSILFTLAVFMAVFVESFADSLNIPSDHLTNNTEYNLDIQTNFIDSEFKENDKNEALPVEPVVIDLGHELPTITTPGEELKESAIIEYETTTVTNEAPFEEEQGLVESTSLEPITTTKSNATETQGKEFQMETTTEGDTITTVVPLIENTKKVETTVLVETTTPHVEKQTEQELPTTPKIEKLNDLSRFYEDEPSQTRQMRGFNKDADNEIESESESESESSSESQSGHSSENKILSVKDENSAVEDTSDESSEETTVNPKEQLPNEASTQPTVQEVEGVTESIGEIPNEVTIVANVETHTVMKKAGVEDEPLMNTTDQPMQSNPVVDLIFNRSKELLNSSSSLETNNSSVEIPSSTVEIGSSVNSTIAKSKEEETTASLTELNDKEIVETPSEKLGKQSTETETPVVSHPENSSTNLKEVQNTDLNAISETKSNENFGSNHLIDELETSTQAPEVTFGESSPPKEKVLEITPISEDNGIFKKSQDKDVETSAGKPSPKIETEPLQTPGDEISSVAVNSILNSEIEASTEAPSASEKNESKLSEDVQEDQTVKIDDESTQKVQDNHISSIDESLPDPKLYADENESPSSSSEDKREFITTTDYARHVDTLQTMRDETSSMVTNEVIAPASVGRSFNEIIAEGLGKPLPTRSVGDEPSSSSYSSEDKTTTVIVLCAAAGGIFLAFSFAIYLISFQRQNGVLDIEMQEQRCGKDNLDEDDDSETRVSLLNQMPTADSDEHSSY